MVARTKKTTTKPKVTTTNEKQQTSNTTNKPVQFKAGTQEAYNKLQQKDEHTWSTLSTSSKPRRTHVVQWGESIQSIAGLYSMPVMKLVRLNGTDKISVGQTIYID